MKNNGSSDFNNLVVALSADPGFLETKHWKIDALKADSELRISDREIRPNASFLSDLVESLRGEVKIEVRQGDVTGELLYR